jgi:hypothetical protein
MPVEISDGVWAIGDAHSNSNASGIDLGHNPFRVKVSGCHRTDFRTRWMITVHARHGKEVHLHIGINPFDFGDEVHPEFCPPQFGLLLSCKGDVILLPAGHHTGLTACAFIKINHHSPSVHFPPGIEQRDSTCLCRQAAISKKALNYRLLNFIHLHPG